MVDSYVQLVNRYKISHNVCEEGKKRMVYIIYCGKDNNNMHVFSVKKIGRDTILAAHHNPSFVKCLLWGFVRALRYQYLVFKGGY